MRDEAKQENAGRRGGRFHLWTIGCQMNEADAARAGALLERHGWRAVEDVREADLALLNTCVIRQQSEDKAVGRLAYMAELKQRTPGLTVALMGCMVGKDGGKGQGLPERFPQEAWEKRQMKTWVLTQGAWGSSVSTMEWGLGGPRAPPLRTQPSHPCPSQTEGTGARRLSPSSLRCWLGRVRTRPNSILPPHDLHLLNTYCGHHAQGGSFCPFLACTRHDLTSQTLYPYVPISPSQHIH